MPFKKGQSGNPSGRAKKTPELLEVEALCRDLSPEAVKRLAHWMRNGEGPVAIRAAEAIINRGFGKPAQTLEHKGTVSHDLSQLSDAELYAIISRGAGGEGDRPPPKDKKRLN